MSSKLLLSNTKQRNKEMLTSFEHVYEKTPNAMFSMVNGALVVESDALCRISFLCGLTVVDSSSSSNSALVLGKPSTGKTLLMNRVREWCDDSAVEQKDYRNLVTNNATGNSSINTQSCRNMVEVVLSGCIETQRCSWTTNKDVLLVWMDDVNILTQQQSNTSIDCLRQLLDHDHTFHADVKTDYNNNSRPNLRHL